MTALFVKLRTRRIDRHRRKLNPLGAKLAAALPKQQVLAEDTPRNHKFLAKRANYQGHERPVLAVRVSVTGCTDGEGIFRGDPNRSLKIAKEIYVDDRTR
jgi:hypothetical protein